MFCDFVGTVSVEKRSNIGRFFQNGLFVGYDKVNSMPGLAEFMPNLYYMILKI